MEPTVNLSKIMILCLFLGVGGCVNSPLGPVIASSSTSAVPIPTMAATPLPGQYTDIPFTVLGMVPCSGSVADASAAIIRNTTELNNYLASAACANPVGAISLSGFNFAAQSILILQFQNCPNNSISTSLDIWSVYQMSGYIYARCDIDTPGTASPQNGCVSVAVAIPATTQGATWTICEQLPSYHCLKPITP